ncbi:hypothetical protein HNP38_002905 [Chryseobacterium defluvii]|uniref:Peptidase S74 domain-containing protein n=1 Tax=Chryseobacterium defluvii TaxID=160396 RepID=A0A840KDK3_9FLAO|nr:tail fiber domain-containing protein [Chryseobacterium defluvii]MBB4807599.1 hypothetical protein [Chryseobacterium defluvii]
MKKNLLLGSILFSTSIFSQVGIGTSNPQATLDIVAKIPTGTASGVDGIIIPRVDRERAQSMSSVVTSTIIYVNNASTGSMTGTAAHIDAIGFYYFDGTSWEKLMGSGGGEPDTSIYKSDGTLVDNRTVTMSDKTLNFNSSASTGTSHFAVDGNTFSVDALNNRIGIGTTSPNSKLQVAGGITSTATGIAFTGNGVSLSSETNYDRLQSWNSRHLILNSQGNNVGVGSTTVPVAPFQVGDNKFRFYPAGTGSKTDPIFMLGNNGNWQRITTGSAANIGFWANGNGATDDAAQLMLTSAGNLGLGTTGPGTKLDIVGQAVRLTNSAFTSYYEATNGSSRLLLQNDNGAGYVGMLGAQDFAIRTNNLARLTVLSGGNVGIGTASPSTLLHVNGTITASRIQGPSDIRFKTNVKLIENALGKIIKLNGYTYDWKDASQFPGQTLGKGHDVGIIAQEVEKLFPEAVSTNAEGYKAVNYSALIPVLIEALKEQQKQIEGLKKQVNQSYHPSVSL